MDTQYRISGGTEFFMKFFGISVYCINFFIELTTAWIGIGLILSPIFMFISYAFFAAWLYKNDVSILEPQIGIKFAISWLISLIPVVNVLYFKLSQTGMPQPGILATISRIISLTREADAKNAEDERKAALNGNENFRNQRFSGRPNGASYRYGEENFSEDDDEYDQAA